MDYELERIEEAPPSPPPSPEPEPLRPDFAEGAAKAPRQRHEATGPAGEHQRRLAQYRMEQDAATSVAQQTVIARVSRWAPRVRWAWRAVIIGTWLGLAFDRLQSAPFVTLAAAVCIMPLWLLGDWWWRWLMASRSAAASPLPPRPPPMPIDGLATPEQLVAERRWQDGIAAINDALAQLRLRWRQSQAIVVVGALGVYLMALALALLTGEESRRLVQDFPSLGWFYVPVTCGLGIAAATLLAWLAVLRDWGPIRCAAMFCVACPLLNCVPLLLYGASLFQFPFHMCVLIAPPVGWLLGLWIEHLDRSVAQRTG